MSTPPRKVHFEFSPGLIWCQAGRTSREALMSPRPEEVTCKSCQSCPQWREKQATNTPQPGDPRGPGVPR